MVIRESNLVDGLSRLGCATFMKFEPTYVLKKTHSSCQNRIRARYVDQVTCLVRLLHAEHIVDVLILGCLVLQSSAHVSQ